MGNSPDPSRPNYFKIGAFDFIASIGRRQDQIIRLMDEATTHIAGTETPSYTGVDQSRFFVEMALPYFEAGKCMPAEYLSPRTNPLFANPIDLKAVDAMFETLLTFYRMPPPFLIPAYQFFLGATLMLPDSLIPSFEFNAVDDNSTLPFGLMDSRTFRVILNVREALTGKARIPATIRHEMYHLAQQIRGIQLGLSEDILQFSKPSILAEILIAFPSISESDPIHKELIDFYETGTFHNLLRFTNTAKEVADLAGLGMETLKAIASILEIKVGEDLYSAASALHPALSCYMTPLSPEIQALLSKDDIIMIEEMRENQKTLYLQEPIEAEVYAIDRFGLSLGNPYLLIEAGDERGVLQMPLEEGARRAFFDQLAEAATARKAHYLRSSDPLGLNNLLGGKQEAPPAQMDLRSWFDPRAMALPSVDDVRELARKVGERAVAIRDRAERIARINCERLTIK